MRILVDPGTPTCTNMGDVAMLQVAVGRLRELWPTAVISVLTNAPERLQAYCPGVESVPEAGRRAWCDGLRMSRFFGTWLAARMFAWQALALDGVRSVLPARLRGRLLRRAERSIEQWRARGKFLCAMHAADLHLVCGQATLADDDRTRALRLLDTAALALARQIPVAAVGQAIGPLADPELLRRSRAVLPRFGLLAVRERRTAPALLASLGVPAERVCVTGDDAVELGQAGSVATPGRALGVHLRRAPLAIADAALLGTLTDVLRTLSRELQAPMVPLPISHHRPAGAYDPAVLATALQGCDVTGDGGATTDSPSRLIAAASSCRVVVSAAYHAAVFALCQGIPAICIGQSPYYLTKFRGLADLFGPGCVVVDLSQPNADCQLRDAVRRVWAEADSLRSALLIAAGEQRALGRMAYARLGRLATDPGASGDVRHRRTKIDATVQQEPSLDSLTGIPS
jgi:colanic acid/amylovoran biosynthesis protein